MCVLNHTFLWRPAKTASVSWPALNIALKPSFRSPSPPTPVRCKNKIHSHPLTLLGELEWGCFNGIFIHVRRCVITRTRRQITSGSHRKECRRIWSPGGKMVFKSWLELDLRSYEFQQAFLVDDGLLKANFIFRVWCDSDSGCPCPWVSSYQGGNVFLPLSCPTMLMRADGFSADFASFSALLHLFSNRFSLIFSLIAISMEGSQILKMVDDGICWLV